MTIVDTLDAFDKLCDDLRTVGPTLNDPVVEAAYGFEFLCNSLQTVSPFLVNNLRDQLKTLHPVLQRKVDKIGRMGASSRVLEAPRFAPSMAKAALNRMMHDPVPAVIEGACAATEAVKTWTPQWFGEHYGSYELPLAKGRSQAETGTIAEVVDDIVSGRERGKYIHNVANLFNKYPELEAKLELERLLQYVAPARFFGTQIFMGGAKTGTSWHCASGLNFFINVYGEKRWYMSHPKHSPWMYGTLHESGTFAHSPTDHSTPQADQRKEFPLYSYVPIVEILLKPGDVLVVPPWWWHAITNMTPATIAVAVRWNSMKGGAVTEPNPLYRLAQGQMPNMKKFEEQSGNDPDFRIIDEFVRDTYNTGIKSDIG